jgi:DNA-binding GntR family transcriptional regulator
MAGPCAWSARTTADVPGISIMPVREAMPRLIADKVLEVRPSRVRRASPQRRLRASSAEVNYLF